ncbi:MAG: thioredoxin [Tessaracoccus sp.]
MAVTDINEQQFADEVLMSPGLVVVDYWADWCAPCKQMAPIIDELSRSYSDVKFVKVDTNTNPNLAAQQGVLSLPTLQFFQSGRVVKALTGGKTKMALKKAIEELL